VRRQRVVLSLAAWDRSGRHLSRDCGATLRKRVLPLRKLRVLVAALRPQVGIGRRGTSRYANQRRSLGRSADTVLSMLLGPDRPPRELAHSVQQR
jgi:hypothetical protein